MRHQRWKHRLSANLPVEVVQRAEDLRLYDSQLQLFLELEWLPI